MSGIKAAYRSASICRLRESEQHQDCGCLSGPVGAKKAKNLTFLNSEIERIDRELIVVALGKVLGLDNCAHRRPRRKNTTASPRTTSATMPKPTQPHMVGVETVTLNSTDLFTSGALAVRVNK